MFEQHILPTFTAKRLNPCFLYIYKMALAFVLINADLGTEGEIVKEIKKIEEIKEVHLVYGVYDIIAKVQADTLDKLKDAITWKIRRLDKVRSTLTMIVVEE
jgi:DNA-binding Lrp family transcriptional regulator